PARRRCRVAERSAGRVRAHETTPGDARMRVRKLGPFGAEADSIDAPFREIWDAFFAAQILVFRAQELSAERYLAFARQFGRPEPHVIDQFHHPEHADILI